MLLSEAFATYRRAEVMAGGLSSKTDESYLYAGKLAVSYFGDVDVTKVSAEDVRSYYEHLLGWQKPDTARGNIVCLRAVFKMLKRHHHDALDPEEIKVPKREKRQINYLTEPEVREFIEIVAERRRGYSELNRRRNVAIVEVLFASGIRVSELCRLNRNSIKNRQFVVVGKSKEPRPCYISERAEKAIRSYMELRTDTEPALFISNQNEGRITAGNVRRVFQNACNRSEFVDVHPHTIRHSFATYMLEKGVDLRYISDFMGHQSLDTTKIYTHYTNPKLRAIYDTVMQ